MALAWPAAMTASAAPWASLINCCFWASEKLKKKNSLNQNTEYILVILVVVELHSCTAASGPENLKKSRQKNNSRNQINQKMFS